MPPSEMARLTKAIEDNTKAVLEQNKILKKLGGLPGPLRFVNHPYSEEKPSAEQPDIRGGDHGLRGPYGLGVIPPPGPYGI